MAEETTRDTDARRGGYGGTAADRGRMSPRTGDEGYASEPPRARTPYEVDRAYVAGAHGGEPRPPEGYARRRHERGGPEGRRGPVERPLDASPGPYSGRGPRGYRRSDERVREDLCDALTEHPRLDPSEVEVEVSDAEVVLRGELPSLRLKRLAEDIAYDVAGVHDVFNRIRVRR